MYPPKKQLLRKQSQAEHCDNIASGGINLEGWIHDKMSAAPPKTTFENTIFHTLLQEALTVAQFFDGLCIDIRHQLSRTVVHSFPENKNGLLCRKVSHN